MTFTRLLTWIHASVFAAFLAAWTIALLSPVPSERAERALGGPWEVFLFGKGLHITAYAFLTALGGTIRCLARRWVWVLPALVVHGALIEFLQQFVGRGSSVGDVGLDSIGIAIGGLVVWLVRGRRADRGKC
jgi:hypothetical protein